MGIAKYEGSVTSTKLKVTGIDLFSAGDFIGDDTTESIVMQDAASGVYKKVVLKDNVIQGAVMYGDTVDGDWYLQLIAISARASCWGRRIWVTPVTVVKMPRRP